MHEHARLALESRVAAAREKFFDQNALPSDLVAKPILRSWDRCRSAGIDERHPLAFDPVGRARLAECRERHEELRRLAEPPAARLAAAVAGARHMVIVTDADGVVVSVFGDRSRVSRTLQLLARPGVDLSERAIGTNSMGTSLRERLPVAVTAAEHYCRTNAGFVCMAAPLFLPDGTIAGTIDVTGDYDRSAPPLAAPVLGAAKAIEIGLFLATQRGRLLLQFAWDATELGGKEAGWLAFDDAGRRRARQAPRGSFWGWGTARYTPASSRCSSSALRRRCACSTSTRHSGCARPRDSSSRPDWCAPEPPCRRPSGSRARSATQAPGAPANRRRWGRRPRHRRRCAS